MKLDKEILLGTKRVDGVNVLIVSSEGLKRVMTRSGSHYKNYRGNDTISIPLITIGGEIKLPKFIRATFNNGYVMEFNPIYWNSDHDELNLLNRKKGFQGEWDNNELSPEMIDSAGDKSILDDWDFYLVKEDGDNTRVIGKLMKNNIFRFADGSYAPVVLCAAGLAERPWETEVDEGYAIVRAWNTDKHLLHGNTSDGHTIFGIFNDRIVIDGCESVLIEKTGVCADLPTEYDGILRCIPMKGIDTGCGNAGGVGEHPCGTFEHGSYYKVNASFLTNMTKARAKNTVSTAVSIFSEKMFIQHMSHVTAHLLKYGTFDLHAINKFSGGISSNYTINGESAGLYGKVTGFRYKTQGDTDWTTLVNGGNSIPDFYFEEPGGSRNSLTPWNWLNNYHAYTQVLEPQCVLSYAVENNIQAGTVFMYNGRKWHYENVPGTIGVLEGEMNARLFMHFDDEGEGLTDLSWTVEGFSTDGAAKTIVLQGIFEIPVVDGYVSWGDKCEFAGGEEFVARKYTVDDGTEVQKSQIYLCTKQSELTSIVDTDEIDLTERIDIIENYRKVMDITTPYRSGWTAGGCYPYSFRGIESGGDMHTGNCAYAADYIGANTGKLKRGELLLRGDADVDYVSARFCDCDDCASISDQYFAFAYQIRLKDL